MMLNHVDIRAKLAVIQKDLESTSPFLASVDRVRKPFRQCGSILEYPRTKTAKRGYFTAYPCSHIWTTLYSSSRKGNLGRGQESQWRSNCRGKLPK
jgi:hypothetical protein